VGARGSIRGQNKGVKGGELGGVGRVSLTPQKTPGYG